MKAFGYFTNNDTFIKRGEYRPTTLDAQKKAVDFLIVAVDDKYTITFNRPTELKQGRSIKAANGGRSRSIYYVTEAALNKLKKQYTWMCDF